MYPLTLEAMLQTLQGYRTSGTLRTDLPAGIPGLQGRCQVEITLVGGKATSCIITGLNGQIEGKEALRALARLGVLEWKLTQQANVPKSIPQPSTMKKAPLPIPKRGVPAQEWQINSWPRIHRAVYGLIDGKNSTEQIATSLSLPLTTVEKVLIDLQSIHVVIKE